MWYGKKKCDNNISTIFWKSHDISITIYRQTLCRGLDATPPKFRPYNPLELFGLIHKQPGYDPFFAWKPVFTHRRGSDGYPLPYPTRTFFYYPYPTRIFLKILGFRVVIIHAVFSHCNALITTMMPWYLYNFKEQAQKKKDNCSFLNINKNWMQIKWQ